MKKSVNLATGVEGDDVAEAIRTQHVVHAEPRLRMDWNWNRYTSPLAVNTPDDQDVGFDIEHFPIESIVEPLRPTKGVAKARVGESVASRGYITSKTPKFYASSVDDIYKYWTSPYITNGSGVFPLHTDTITTARPRVEYKRTVDNGDGTTSDVATTVRTNKIVIAFEDTWASPENFTIHISTAVAGPLSLIATNPVVASDGTVTLYWSNGAWVSVRPDELETESLPTISVIELRVTTMGPGIRKDGTVMEYHNGDGVLVPTTGANSSLNVISIEAHLEADMTDRLSTVSDTFDMGDVDQLYPIGTITTNQASLSLFNDDGWLNAENNDVDNPFVGLIEPNARVNLEYIYDLPTGQFSVQQFDMFVSSWSPDSEGEVGVELEDYSKYLKEMKPRAFMVENKTSAEIVWRLLDSVGFSDYQIGSEDRDDTTDHIIPVFWTTGEETVWEALDEIAKATQTAIYFDSDGQLQVRTREAAFREDVVDLALLDRDDAGTGTLSNIYSWSPESEYEANKINVLYKTTKWKVNSMGKPAMSKVWEPDSETVTLRSSPLVRTITNTSNFIYIPQKDVRIWPFASKVQIDGEVIAYEGKHFVYYTMENGVQTRNATIVKSHAEARKLHRTAPAHLRRKSHYTGGLKIVEREVWNTSLRDHSVDVNGWTTKLELDRRGGDVRRLDPRGFRHNKSESTVTINTPRSMKDADDTFWAFRGQAGATGYKVYGTRIKFNKDKASSTQTGGLCFQMSGARENGYYVEVKLTKNLGRKGRKIANEISIISRTAGKEVVLDRGAASAIAENIWYDIDVYHSGTGNDQRISVWLNGQVIAQSGVSAATAQADSGRFGIFAKGKTNVDIEYIYGVDRSIKEPLDDYGFYDLKYGGIRGGQWEREYVWETRTRRRRIRKKRWVKEKYRHNQYLFDEFGPYVHEVREYDVKFDPAPVRYSYLFSTNEWYSAQVEYVGNPTGAKFIVANTGRINAVLHGEDRLVYAGAGNGVNQVFVVLGQNLEIADEEMVTEKNEPAIRARGEIEVELSSDWIQSKAMAKDIASWMNRHWGGSVDEVRVEVFGNPIVEIGDIVSVKYDEIGATPATHEYFVVGTQTDFDKGVGTTLRLRRRRPVL